MQQNDKNPDKFPFAYLPYAFLNLINPFISDFYGYTGISMTKLDKEPKGDPQTPRPESTN